MRPRFLIGVIVAALVAFAVFGMGMRVGARSSYGGAWGPGMMMGRGWMGPGMMGGYGYGMGPRMMGPGMMGGYGYGMGPNMMGGYGYGYGMGPWMMGPGGYGSQTALNLSVDDVRSSFERWLAFQGNPRVKLGMVSETDADTITVDILTTDKDGLVQRFAVDRHTGFSRPSGG